MASSSAPSISGRSTPPPLSSTTPMSGTIASLPVTPFDTTVDDSEQILARVLKDFEQQQAALASPPSLNPSRVTAGTVADDLDDILSEALKDTSQACSVPAATAPVPEIKVESITTPANLQPLFLSLVRLDFQRCLEISPSPSELEDVARKISHLTRIMNQFFVRLLKQPTDSLGVWLDQESKLPFFKEYHPFSTSSFLTTKLAKLNSLIPHIDSAIMKEWSLNYQRSCLLLKGILAFYNLEEPALDQMTEAIENVVSALPEHPELKEQLKSMQSSLQVEDPNQLANIKKYEELCLFFKELDQELKKDPNNKILIQSWLDTQKSSADYSSPFFLAKQIARNKERVLGRVEDLPPHFVELNALYVSCCSRLSSLGLSEYSKERPSPLTIAESKLTMMRMKDILQQSLNEALFVFRSLGEKLRQLPNPPQEPNSNQREIENWFTDFKSKNNYHYPFIIGEEIEDTIELFEEVLSKPSIEEFKNLYPFCRDQLLQLGLKKYITETPEVTIPEFGAPLSTSTASVAAPAAAPQEISITERFEKEIKFFRLFGEQQNNLQQWLEENSVKFDYPLLWGQKRSSQFSRYRDVVSFDERRAWRDCFETCVEKLETPELKRFIDLSLIPAEASPQLRAFLSAS